MTGTDLKALRLRLGMSAAKFAAFLGVAEQRTIRRWEAGEAPIPGPVALLMRGIGASAAVRSYYGLELRDR